MIKFILYNYNVMERICYYFNKYKDICQNDKKSIWYLGNLDKVWRPLNTEMYTNEEFYKNINIDNIKFIMSNLNLTNLTYGFEACGTSPSKNSFVSDDFIIIISFSVRLYGTV